MSSARVPPRSSFRRLFVLVLTLIASVALAAPEEAIVAPGVVHEILQVPGPNVINLVRIDRGLPQYGLKLGFPFGRRNFPERETLPEIVSREGGEKRVLAGINGSFFGDGSQIDGPLISGGDLIQCPPSRKAAFLWTRSRGCLVAKPGEGGHGTLEPPEGGTIRLNFINRVRGRNSVTLYAPDWGPSTGTTGEGIEVILRRVSGPFRPSKEVSGVVESVKTGAGSINNLIPPDGMVVSARDAAAERLRKSIRPNYRVRLRWIPDNPNLADAELAIGGAGWILKDGKPFQENWALYAEEFAHTRHPRTAVAWNKDYLWFFTCDGRQPDRSVGMTFREMADFLSDRLGATDAVNLDGGGSTTLTIGSRIVNSPCDGLESSPEGTPRKIADALLLVEEREEFTIPFRDDFAPGGRSLSWDDRFTYNGIVPFSPATPDGDGYVLEVKDPSGGYDTVSLGSPTDRDYAVEAEVFCRYRPDEKGFERYGIFARDNGGGDFLSSKGKKGNCYALFYDSGTGRICAARVTDGEIVDFSPNDSLNLPTTGWRKLRIECKGAKIKYLVDGGKVVKTEDETHKSGPCGIGYHEYFKSNALMTAAYAENFRVVPLD